MELVTPTVTVHWPFAGMVPPVRDTEPGVCPATPAPQVVVAGAAVVAKPAGSESMNAAPVSATLLPLASVMIRLLVAFVATVEGVNDLLTVGRASTTSVAVLLFAPAPLSVEVTFVAVLFHEPTWAPVTVIPWMHAPPDPSEPPEKVIVDGADKLSVPPQNGKEVLPGKVIPDGNVS